jgi:hypothetical protein
MRLIDEILGPLVVGSRQADMIQSEICARILIVREQRDTKFFLGFNNFSLTKVSFAQRGMCRGQAGSHLNSLRSGRVGIGGLFLF